MTLPFVPRGTGTRPPNLHQLRRIVLIGGALASLGLIVIPWLAGFETDWLWFQEIGFRPVMLTSLIWRVLLFVGGGAAAFAFLYGNLRIARHHSTFSPVRILNAGEATPLSPLVVFLPRLLLGGALVTALLVGGSLSALYMTFLTALHGVSVGSVDPVFGRDIGYYLFTLPAVSILLTTVMLLTVLSLIAALLIYGVRGEIVLNAHRSSADPEVARHLGGLLMVFFVVTAAQLWFVSTAGLLSSTTSSALVGASYTDVHISLPAIRLSAILALAAGVFVLLGVARRTFVRSTMIAIAAYAGLSLVARGLVPSAVQKLLVAPNELSRETPYIRDHIVATRQAWGLEHVETHELNGEVRLTMADILANGATIGNVRLWERDYLQQTFKQLQEIQTYYDFVSVDDDRYMIDGQYRQVHLAARELNTAKLPTRTFINERMTYTHGMGVTMAPVNQATDEGLPVLFIKDLPPVSTVSIKLTRPQIYYGELTNSYVFVGTGQREFDSPAANSDRYANYTGRGGVPIGSFFRRALYAWQLGSLKMLLSSDIRGNARVLYRRNIAERASTALPFLDFDPDPLLIVTDAGQLKWMLDAYTTSSEYPYAARTESGASYMRNSVKVVIDAYDGTVDAYIADPTDPIIRTYAKVFDGIFKPMSAMPADLRRHVRYPGNLFRIQTQLQATYHMVDPDQFYHRENQWQIPGGTDSGSAATEFMRHIIMRLPGEQNPEFIFMTPFTPRGKDNLAAWMVARMDGDNYGKLVVYEFPRQSLVYGPKQIATRISQETDISQQITLWDQKGSRVLKGELLVIPIEESLIYVQPLYLEAEGGGIPELKRVVVAHENRVVMAETLQEGLNELFGAGATNAIASAGATGSPSRDSASAATGAGNPAAMSGSLADLLHQAQQDYDAALAAERAGNWAEYGKQIDRLGTVLKQLRAGKQ